MSEKDEDRSIPMPRTVVRQLRGTQPGRAAPGDRALNDAVNVSPGRTRPRSLRTLVLVSARACSKTGCSRPAVSTLTFVYADSTVVVGPLARESEPGAYDLCREHAAAMTEPRGWTMLRVPGSADAVDDLVALAHAVGDEDPRDEEPSGPQRAYADGRGTRSAAAPHLHVVRDSRD
jgi:hypothetical protein